ncbi:hypothetical protein [Alistipes sp.]|uniref:hypothetical protein n=1 Tax=Alistipes sp. TaxID=1872444 RepID=UPI003AF19329
MKVIYNDTLPFGRFTAMTVMFWIFVRNGKRFTTRMLNHERIHARQQLEIAAACLLLGFVVASLTGAWWWLLACVPAPFLVYALSVAIEVLLPPYDQVYRNSCFESEAIYNEHRRDYTRRWWRHLFAWVRYISNAKYPYIPHEDRPPMQD